MAEESITSHLTINDSGLPNETPGHSTDDTNTAQGNISVVYSRLPVPSMSSVNIDA